LGRRIGRRLAGATLVLAIPVLAACGFGVQTDQVYQPAVGVNDRSGEVDVLGALVVSAKPGSGVFIASLSNNDPTRADKLVGIQGEGIQVATGVSPQIPAGGLVNLADKSQGGGVPVQGAQVKAGGFVTVQLSFANADPVTVEVPVVTNTGPYSSFAGPTSSPSPVASPGSTGAPSTRSPSPSASTSASPTASPTA
jgi:hypothetical protein